MGLIITIPIAIGCTIYAFWAEITGKKGQPTESTRYPSYGGGIEDLDTTEIPYSGYSAAERAAEYRRRGQSPSGVIDGVYNDTYLPMGYLTMILIVIGMQMLSGKLLANCYT